MAAADAERVQCQRNRIGAVRAADAVRGAGPCGELALEGFDLLAEDVAAGVEHGLDRAVDLGAARGVGGVRIGDGDHRHPSRAAAHSAATPGGNGPSPSWCHRSRRTESRANNCVAPTSMGSPSVAPIRAICVAGSVMRSS